MLVETGTVIAVEQGSLWVETLRRTTCGSCSVRQGCGHGLLNRLGDRRRNLIRVLIPADRSEACQIRDEVRIGIPEDVIVKGSLVVYLLPLLVLLAGAALGDRLANGAEAGAVAGAAIGFALGCLGVHVHARRHRDDQALQPVLLEVLRRSAQPLELS